MLTVIPVRVAGGVKPGDRLDSIILGALGDSGTGLADGDIVVVAQKVVSKAEGRIVDLGTVRPSKKAASLARKLKKDPRVVELILKEAKEVVKVQNGIIITETRHGLVCANSGVDQSNLEQGSTAALLPVNPDASAKRLRDSLRPATGRDIAVIITDTFGRPFREGQVNVAVGLAGLRPIKSYIGKNDMYGRRLRVTEIAVADEVASAAELVMGKAGGVPVAIVRGCDFEKYEKGSAKRLVRPKKNDLFRR